MAKDYALLVLSIVLEVFSTQMMKFSAGFTKIIPTALFAAGMTAALSVVIWKERIDLQMVIGFALIIIGCVLLNLRRG